MRIIHFSDIHAVPRLGSVSSYFDKRLLGYFNYRLRRRAHMDWNHVQRFVQRVKTLEPDLVICTGDMTTLGEPREFDLAKQALAPLVEDDSFDFLYVPGNHDAYVKRKASQASLHQAFKWFNRDRWRLDQLPLVHTCGELKFLLLNQGSPAPLWGSYGTLDERTRQWLDKHLPSLFEEPHQIVLISHFPLFDENGKALHWRRACRHVGPLQEALRNGQIALALCGHIHRPFTREEPEGGLELCAGSLTQSGTFALIEYEAASETFQSSWLPASRQAN